MHTEIGRERRFETSCCLAVVFAVVHFRRGGGERRAERSDDCLAMIKQKVTRIS
jgi:hypothetical protein